ncbi:unnamed protein product [Amoebophrya sp. A120]|nr:unnamed protein product [Amoebophrya sp. A120]|eukprot:GSA120T00025589001.1
MKNKNSKNSRGTPQGGHSKNSNRNGDDQEANEFWDLMKNGNPDILRPILDQCRANQMDVTISKSLAHMLRHAAGTNNLEIRKDGYAKLSSIMKTKDFKGKHTIEQVMAVCYYDSKSRFSMIREAGVNTEYLVRANQGHTMKNVNDEQLLQKITDPTSIQGEAIHGTYTVHWPFIKQQGLSKAARNHIHLAQGLPQDGKIRGMRSSAEIFIYVDLGKAMADGIVFYESSNGVILTIGDEGWIGTKYFKKVEKIDPELLTATPLDFDQLDKPTWPAELAPTGPIGDTYTVKNIEAMLTKQKKQLQLVIEAKRKKDAGTELSKEEKKLAAEYDGMKLEFASLEQRKKQQGGMRNRTQVLHASPIEDDPTVVNRKDRDATPPWQRAEREAKLAAMAKQNHGITDRDTAQWSALREAKDKKLKQFEDLGLRTSSSSNAAGAASNTTANAFAFGTNPSNTAGGVVAGGDNTTNSKSVSNTTNNSEINLNLTNSHQSSGFTTNSQAPWRKRRASTASVGTQNTVQTDSEFGSPDYHLRGDQSGRNNWTHKLGDSEHNRSPTRSPLHHINSAPMVQNIQKNVALLQVESSVSSSSSFFDDLMISGAQQPQAPGVPVFRKDSMQSNGGASVSSAKNVLKKTTSVPGPTSSASSSSSGTSRAGGASSSSAAPANSIKEQSKEQQAGPGAKNKQDEINKEKEKEASSSTSHQPPQPQPKPPAVGNLPGLSKQANRLGLYGAGGTNASGNTTSSLLQKLQAGGYGTSSSKETANSATNTPAIGVTGGGFTAGSKKGTTAGASSKESKDPNSKSGAVTANSTSKDSAEEQNNEDLSNNTKLLQNNGRGINDKATFGKNDDESSSPEKLEVKSKAVSEQLHSKKPVTSKANLAVDYMLMKAKLDQVERENKADLSKLPVAKPREETTQQLGLPESSYNTPESASLFSTPTHNDQSSQSASQQVSGLASGPSGSANNSKDGVVLASAAVGDAAAGDKGVDTAKNATSSSSPPRPDDAAAAAAGTTTAAGEKISSQTKSTTAGPGHNNPEVDSKSSTIIPAIPNSATSSSNQNTIPSTSSTLLQSATTQGGANREAHNHLLAQFVASQSLSSGSGFTQTNSTSSAGAAISAALHIPATGATSGQQAIAALLQQQGAVGAVGTSSSSAGANANANATGGTITGATTSLVTPAAAAQQLQAQLLAGQQQQQQGMNLVGTTSTGGATNGNINAAGGAQAQQAQQNSAAALSAGMLAQQLANLGLTAAGGTTTSSSPQGTLAAAAAVSSLLQQQNQQQNAAALNGQQNAAAQKPASGTGSGMSAQAYPTRTKEQMINLIREDKIMCHNETWGYKTSVGEQNFLKPFDQEEMEIWRELEPFQEQLKQQSQLQQVQTAGSTPQQVPASHGFVYGNQYVDPNTGTVLQLGGAAQSVQALVRNQAAQAMGSTSGLNAAAVTAQQPLVQQQQTATANAFRQQLQAQLEKSGVALPAVGNNANAAAAAATPASVAHLIQAQLQLKTAQMNQQSMNQNPQQHLLHGTGTGLNSQLPLAQQQHNLVDQNAEYEYRPPHMLQQQQQNNSTANFMGGGSGAAPGGINNNSGINSVHAIMRGNNQQQGNNMNAGVVGNITAGGSSSQSSSSAAAHLVHGQQNMYHANTNSKNNNAGGTGTNQTHTQSNSIQNLDEQYEYRPPPRANNKPAPNFVTSSTSNALQQSNSSSAASLFQHSNNLQQRLNNQNSQQGTSGGMNSASNNSNYNFNPPPAPVGGTTGAGMNSNRHSTSSKGAQATSNANSSYKGSFGGGAGGGLHQGQQHQHHNPHSGGGNPGPNSSGLHATYSQNSQWSSDATYSQHSGPVGSAGGNLQGAAYQQQLYNQGKQQSGSGGFPGPTQGSKNTMAQQQEQIQWTDVTTNQHKGSGGGSRYNQQFGAGSLGQQHGSGDNRSIRSDSNWHQHPSSSSSAGQASGTHAGKFNNNKGTASASAVGTAGHYGGSSVAGGKNQNYGAAGSSAQSSYGGLNNIGGGNQKGGGAGTNNYHDNHDGSYGHPGQQHHQNSMTSHGYGNQAGNNNQYGNNQYHGSNAGGSTGSSYGMNNQNKGGHTSTAHHQQFNSQQHNPNQRSGYGKDHSVQMNYGGGPSNQYQQQYGGKDGSYGTGAGGLNNYQQHQNSNYGGGHNSHYNQQHNQHHNPNQSWDHKQPSKNVDKGFEDLGRLRAQAAEGSATQSGTDKEKSK